MHEVAKHGLSLILVRNEIIYKQPCHLGDRIFDIIL